MSCKFCYHTHTNLCDGADAPEETVLRAIELGLDTLGFSGHLYTAFDDSYCMSRENTEYYRKEVGRLKDKYADRITVLCGGEQDFYTEEAEDWDYIIGSVHYVLKNGVYAEVDGDKKELRENIENLWDGDFDAFAEDYFETVGRVYEKTSCRIVGHFDLLTKHGVFDENTVRYRAAAKKAVEKLCKEDILFEVNTGAMARGLKTVPYPSRFILECIKKNGGRVTFSSDCHDKEKLDYGYAQAQALIRSCGFEKFDRI